MLQLLAAARLIQDETEWGRGHQGDCTEEAQWGPAITLTQTLTRCLLKTNLLLESERD